MVTHRARRVVEVAARLGEGPLWDPDRGGLWFVDILGQGVHFWDGELHTISAPGAPGAVVLDAAGDLVAALPDRVVRRTRSGWTDLFGFDPDPVTRANDGVPDGAGNLLQGTMGWDGEPRAGALWRLRPDGSATVLLDDLTVSNGLAVVDEELWHIDSPTGQLRRYTYDPDEPLDGPIDVVEVAGGFPDGLAVDANGNVWVALWGGGRVVQLDRTGTLLATVVLPVSQPTSCAFGPPGSGQLWITSAADGVDEPEAGDLFVAEVGVDGLPVPRFGRS